MSQLRLPFSQRGEIMRTRKLDGPELAAILAGLRLYQRALKANEVPDVIRQIASDDDSFPALDENQVDFLAEWLPNSRFELPAGQQRR
jgi:hypothetical protein